MSTNDITYLNEKLKELRKKRDESKVPEIVRMKAKLDDSYRMLDENYEDISEANMQYLKDRSIVEPENRRRLNQFLRKFQKLLFNYLASFSSYIDHTRHFVRGLRVPQLIEEYDRIKKEKRIAEKTQFIKDLHNYSHHAELPVPGVCLVYMVKKTGELNGVIKGELSLRKEDLLRWECLHPISKNFLQQYPEEDIIIVSWPSLKHGFLDKCQISTRELHNWLCAKVKELFHSEFTDFMEIQSEIEILEQELRKHDRP